EGRRPGGDRVGGDHRVPGAHVRQGPPRAARVLARLRALPAVPPLRRGLRHAAGDAPALRGPPRRRRRAARAAHRERDRAHMGWLDAELEGRAWFVGEDLTAADIQLSFAIQATRLLYGLDHFPNLVGFLERIHA